MKINLREVGFALAIASDLLAIVADATHKADRVLERRRAMGAIEAAKEDVDP